MGVREQQFVSSTFPHMSLLVRDVALICILGGVRFATSKTTLLAAEGSFFHAMLAGGKWKPDADGT